MRDRDAEKQKNNNYQHQGSQFKKMVNLLFHPILFSSPPHHISVIPIPLKHKNMIFYGLGNFSYNYFPLDSFKQNYPSPLHTIPQKNQSENQTSIIAEENGICFNSPSLGLPTPFSSFTPKNTETHLWRWKDT